jgi:hypothetical protein
VRLIPPVALIIAVVALAVALFALAIGEEDSLRFDAVILTDHRDEDEFESDLGDRGDSAGDIFGRIHPLQRDGEAGTELSLCTRTMGSEENSTFACTTTLEFDEGSIVSEGTFDVALRDEEQEFAILGGTGDYEGARGTVTLKSYGEDRYLASVDAKTED